MSPAAGSRKDRPDTDLVSGAQDLIALICQGVPGCDGASLTLIRDGRPLTVAHSHDFVLDLDKAQYVHDDGPCLAAIREHADIVVCDISREARWPELAPDMTAAGVRSSLSMPLPSGSPLTGGINLYAHEPDSFDEQSCKASRAFAQQAALLLGYLDRLRDERAAHAQARQTSAVLQRSLLPALPEIPGLTTAARYLVGSGTAQVGGDWYDLFALPDGAIGVAVGDVMGHDIAAAAAMGQLRSVLRSYAYEGSSPSVVLGRLDRLVQDFEMAQLATAIYGRLVLDGDGAMLLYTNAGHLPPLLRKPDGQVQALERVVTPLIGVAPPDLTRRGEGAVVLPAGSLLLLYTDGLVETRDRDVDQGREQLAEVLRGLPPDATPDEVCDRVVSELLDDEHEDDVVLLVLRVDGLPQH